MRLPYNLHLRARVIVGQPHRLPKPAWCQAVGLIYSARIISETNKKPLSGRGLLWHNCSRRFFTQILPTGFNSKEMLDFSTDHFRFCLRG
jgi:hypothetical protein